MSDNIDAFELDTYLDWTDPDNQDNLTKCNACFGTGMDREWDADCIICFGDGWL